jgi:hypothetical protein
LEDIVKTLTSKEFLMGAAAMFLLLKFGGRLPVVGPTVTKLKGM